MKLVSRGISYYHFVNLRSLCIDICVEIHGSCFGGDGVGVSSVGIWLHWLNIGIEKTIYRIIYKI